MSVKDKFEAHPVVWGLWLIVCGFSAGFSASEALDLKFERPQQSPTQCTVEGIDKLSDAYHQRVASLQVELVRFESKASDDRLISSDQNQYKESADRIRQDIVEERAALASSLNALSAKCK